MLRRHEVTLDSNLSEELGVLGGINVRGSVPHGKHSIRQAPEGLTADRTHNQLILDAFALLIKAISVTA
jgi:hypothetical protein